MKIIIKTFCHIVDSSYCPSIMFSLNENMHIISWFHKLASLMAIPAIEHENAFSRSPVSKVFR